jgi:hypothetical protein
MLLGISRIEPNAGVALGDFSSYVRPMWDYWCTYLGEFWPNLWPLLLIGPIYGFDVLFGRFWPRGKAWLDSISPDRRKSVEHLLIIGVVLYAGFAVWKVEHKARIESEQKVMARPNR